MKQFMFIGDIHGNSDWKRAASIGLNECDGIIFLGDYIDSFHIRAEDQLENLKEIVSFAQDRSYQNITLLLGNHDYAVIHGLSAISGYQHGYASAYKEVFDKNKALFSIAWGHTSKDGKYTLATHAGLAYQFWKKSVLREFKEGEFLHKITEGKKAKDLEIHDTLNYLIDKKDLMWTIGPMRGGFRSPGPLWADYRELIKDPYPNINQIVGHTPMKSTKLTNIDNNFFLCIDIEKNQSTPYMMVSL